MFVPVFWMNTHLKNSWLMMGIEVIVGVIVYIVIVALLKASIIKEAKELVDQKLHKHK